MKKRYIFIIGFIIVFVDQFLKILISGNIVENITLISGILEITLTHNYGAAWGIFEGNQIFLILVSVVAFGLISFYIKKRDSLKLLEIIGYTLLLGGLVGNLIDRVIYGYVVDYIYLLFIDFPIFNFADMAIVIGVGLLVIDMIKEEYYAYRSRKRGN